MRVYTVHERPSPSGQEPDVVLIKEGFCWPAFAAAPLWGLHHRLWLGVIVYLAAVTALAAGAEAAALAPAARLPFFAGFALLVGFEANDWRRRALSRRGYRLLGVSAGRNLNAAERRFFTARPLAPSRP